MNDKIRQALETYADTLAPKLPTAYENVNFSPPVGPYQAYFVLFAEPDDAGYKDSDYFQRGIFTIVLLYPTNQGPGNADARAKLFRQHFKRGTTIALPKYSVVVERTPEITGGNIEDNRFVVRVRVRWYAQVERD